MICLTVLFKVNGLIFKVQHFQILVPVYMYEPGSHYLDSTVRDVLLYSMDWATSYSTLKLHIKMFCHDCIT